MFLPQHQNLWQQLYSSSVLEAAWEKVRRQWGCSGGDNVTIRQFQGSATRRIAELAKSFEAGDWRPAAYRNVDIPKRKGGHRTLRIPSLIDQVLHGAIATVLPPVLEPKFENGSFAYRPRRSVKQVVQAIGRWRDQGYWHVIGAYNQYLTFSVCTPILLSTANGNRNAATNPRKTPPRGYDPCRNDGHVPHGRGRNQVVRGLHLAGRQAHLRQVRKRTYWRRKERQANAISLQGLPLLFQRAHQNAHASFQHPHAQVGHRHLSLHHEPQVGFQHEISP